MSDYADTNMTKEEMMQSLKELEASVREFNTLAEESKKIASELEEKFKSIDLDNEKYNELKEACEQLISKIKNNSEE